MVLKVECWSVVSLIPWLRSWCSIGCGLPATEGSWSLYVLPAGLTSKFQLFASTWSYIRSLNPFWRKVELACLNICLHQAYQLWSFFTVKRVLASYLCCVVKVWKSQRVRFVCVFLCGAFLRSVFLTFVNFTPSWTGGMGAILFRWSNFVWVFTCLLLGGRKHWQQSYLVDPASSHMLVSKIKPCMSKYKQLYTVKLRTAHYISNNLFDGSLLHG